MAISGFFPKDRMVPEFAEAAFSEKVGELAIPCALSLAGMSLK